MEVEVDTPTHEGADNAPATRKRHHRAASGKLSQQRREARKNQRRSVAPSACLPMPYHPNVSGGSYQPSAAIGFNEVLGLQSSCRSDSAFIASVPEKVDYSCGPWPTELDPARVMGIERQGYIRGSNFLICQNRRSGFVYITSEGYGRWRTLLGTCTKREEGKGSDVLGIITISCANSRDIQQHLDTVLLTDNFNRQLCAILSAPRSGHTHTRSFPVVVGTTASLSAVVEAQQVMLEALKAILFDVPALMPHSTRVPVKGFQCERYPGYLLPNTGTHPARTMAEIGGPGVCAGWVLSCRGDVGDVSTAFVFIRKDHRPEPDPMRRVDITGCCNLYVYQSVMVAYLCARRFYKSRMGPTTRFTVSITSDLGLNGSSLGLPVFALLIEALKGLRLDPGTYLTGEVGLDGKCATRVSGLAAKLHAVTPFFVATVKMNPRIKGCKPLVIGVPTDNVRGKVLVEDDPSFLQHGGSRDYKEVRVFEEHGRNIFAASGIRGVLDVMDALLADQDLKGRLEGPCDAVDTFVTLPGPDGTSRLIGLRVEVLRLPSHDPSRTEPEIHVLGVEAADMVSAIRQTVKQTLYVCGRLVRAPVPYPSPADLVDTYVVNIQGGSKLGKASACVGLAVARAVLGQAQYVRRSLTLQRSAYIGDVSALFSVGKAQTCALSDHMLLLMKRMGIERLYAPQVEVLDWAHQASARGVVLTTLSELRELVPNEDNPAVQLNPNDEQGSLTDYEDDD